LTDFFLADKLREKHLFNKSLNAQQKNSLDFASKDHGRWHNCTNQLYYCTVL